MTRAAFFCIPADGHTNPMLPVARRLVGRGGTVRFFSFEQYRERILATGAQFVGCDSFLPKLDASQMAGIMKVSTTEMTIQDIRTTLNMDGFIAGQLADFKPDVIYSDSVCFWGKLNAWKHHVPLVVSTSTMAFNQFSSRYMSHSLWELADIIGGLPKIRSELRKLEPYGYHVRSALQLVSSDDVTDSVVYTSRRFQPYAATFSDHYLFVGPSIAPRPLAVKSGGRPLVYIALGTVINDRPDFYTRVITALGPMDLDVVIACGRQVDPRQLGPLPTNVDVEPYVNQLDVLGRADVFITHCGMNSVSESLYMGTPMVLYPQTGEQRAVARRVGEMGAGVPLKDDTAAGIAQAVRIVLDDKSYARAAALSSSDFHACPGPDGAAAFIEAAPHQAPANGLLARLNRDAVIFQAAYWSVFTILMIVWHRHGGGWYMWFVGLAAGVINSLAAGWVQERILRHLTPDRR